MKLSEDIMTDLAIFDHIKDVVQETAKIVKNQKLSEKAFDHSIKKLFRFITGRKFPSALEEDLKNIL